MRTRAYLLGLLSGLERKNGWSLAEYAGDATPDGMQRLLNHAKWDASAVRDALRAQVAERLGSLDGVLVGDGAKGRRFYDWAWIALEGTRCMLARRSISDPPELAFYRCWATRPAGLPELVRVAGSR